MKLSNLGEFGIIEKVIAPEFKELIRQNFTGIGDDCSITPLKEDMAQIFTTDMLIEKTHFLRDKITPFQLGFKSLAVNLSDIAAMGGTPVASYLSVGLPKNVDIEWVEEFIKGYKALSEKENVPLLGGDTTSCEDKIVINVGVTGEIGQHKVKRRNAAKPGDLICVTGNLGDSGGGLQILLNDLPEDWFTEALLEKHLTPYPHVQEGKWLAEYADVHAMMDVSDGISSDLGHIAKASGVGAVVHLEKLPLSGELKSISKEHNWNPYEMALSGGEDYVLLLTVQKDSFKEIAHDFEKQFSGSLHDIGEITAGDKIVYKQKNQVVEKLKKGYTHF
jgi:thiamine-monophosphate kinase